MSRHLHGTIGAALLCCVALSSYPQTTAPASANAVAKSLGLIMVAGGSKARKEQRASEEQAKSEVQASQTQRQETFKKAMGTCLQGRGYTTG
jgi:hypothetical protein